MVFLLFENAFYSKNVIVSKLKSFETKFHNFVSNDYNFSLHCRNRGMEFQPARFVLPLCRPDDRDQILLPEKQNQQNKIELK